MREVLGPKVMAVVVVVAMALAAVYIAYTARRASEAAAAFAQPQSRSTHAGRINVALSEAEQEMDGGRRDAPASR